MSSKKALRCKGIEAQEAESCAKRESQEEVQEPTFCPMQHALRRGAQLSMGFGKAFEAL